MTWNRNPYWNWNGSWSWGQNWNSNWNPNYGIGFFLSLIAGTVEATTLVGADRIFAAGITVNYVFLAKSILEGWRAQDFLRALTLPLFVLFYVIWEWAPDPKKRWRNNIQILLSVEVLFLSLGGLAPVFFWSDPFWRVQTVVITAILAMASQYRIDRIWKAGSGPTTMMTANSVVVFQSLGRFLSGQGLGGSPEEVRAFTMNCLKIIGFIVGCFVGVFGFYTGGFFILLLPVVILIGILYHLRKKNQRGQDQLVHLETPQWNERDAITNTLTVVGGEVPTPEDATIVLGTKRS